MQLDTEDLIIFALLVLGVILTAVGAWVIYRLYQQSQLERSLENSLEDSHLGSETPGNPNPKKGN